MADGFTFYLGFFLLTGADREPKEAGTWITGHSYAEQVAHLFGSVRNRGAYLCADVRAYQPRADDDE